jgi:hypothetical protein
VLPRSGGYWCDDGSDTAAAPADPSQTASCKLELDETARCYRRFFVGKVSVTLEILVSFSFSPLRSKLKGKLRKTKRESGGFVRSLLHRVGGGVVLRNYAPGYGFHDCPWAASAPCQRWQRALTCGTWRLSLLPSSDGNIIRVTQIYLFDTDKTATLLLCMHTHREKERVSAYYFFFFFFCRSVCVL